MEKTIEKAEGFVIIRHQTTRKVIPIDCPLCEFILIDQIDEQAIQRSGCCFDCENEIVDVNRKRWNDGWRPSKAQLRKIRERRSKSTHSRHN